MTYPYGQRDCFKLSRFDASKSSNCLLKKDSVKFTGSTKHCCLELIRWMHKKDLVDARDILWEAFRLDFTLFKSFRVDKNTLNDFSQNPVKKEALG